MADLLNRRRAVPFWRLYAAIYDRLWDNELTAAVARQVLTLVPAGAEIHDIGAGTGIVTGHLAAAGVAITASEPQSAMRWRLVHRLPSVQVDARDLSAVAASDLDRVLLATNVVHLTADPDAAVQELRGRTTRGVIVVSPVPGTSIGAVRRAMRAAGVPVGRRVSFALWHVVLAPFRTLAGAAVCVPQHATWQDATHVEVVAGVQTVAWFAPATGPAAGAWTPRRNRAESPAPPSVSTLPRG